MLRISRSCANLPIESQVEKLAGISDLGDTEHRLHSLCLESPDWKPTVSKAWIQDLDGDLLSSLLSRTQKGAITRQTLEDRILALQQERNQNLQLVQRYGADIKALKALERSRKCKL